MRVGFIGLGQMGWPMFCNLLRGGVDAIGHDACAELLASLRAGGGADAARLVDTTAALGDLDVVVTMLPHGRAVRDSLLAGGEGALVRRLQPGAVVIDMSSSSPLDTRETARALGEHGVRLLDAPVSGSVPKARDGTLSIMLGGDDAAAAVAMPLLEAMGSRIIRTGGVGSAHAMKALNNYVYAAGLLAASEALLIGKALDLDLGTLVDVFNASSGRNVATETKIRQHMLEGGDFKAGFALRLMAKDLGIADGLKAAVGFEPPQLGLCHALWQDAAEAMPAGADNTEIYRFLESRLGIRSTTHGDSPR